MKTSLVRLVTATFSIALALGVVVSLMGAMLGWQTVVQFSNGLFVAGSLMVILGLVSVIGGYKIRADEKILYSQTTSDMNISERGRRWITDTLQSYGVITFLTLIGAFLIGFSILVGSLRGS